MQQEIAQAYDLPHQLSLICPSLETIQFQPVASCRIWLKSMLFLPDNEHRCDVCASEWRNICKELTLLLSIEDVLTPIDGPCFLGVPVLQSWEKIARCEWEKSRSPGASVLTPRRLIQRMRAEPCRPSLNWDEFAFDISDMLINYESHGLLPPEI